MIITVTDSQAKCLLRFKLKFHLIRTHPGVQASTPFQTRVRCMTCSVGEVAQVDMLETTTLEKVIRVMRILQILWIKMLQVRREGDHQTAHLQVSTKKCSWKKAHQRLIFDFAKKTDFLALKPCYQGNFVLSMLYFRVKVKVHTAG